MDRENSNEKIDPKICFTNGQELTKEKKEQGKNEQSEIEWNHSDRNSQTFSRLNLRKLKF